MIRIGLIGASRIAREAIIEPARDNADIRVEAVAASTLERAQNYALQHEIPIALGSYEALIASNDVDLVYIGLPPHAHKDWTIAALESGKHVLCEKPIALNAGEAAAMSACAEKNNSILIEAFHYRYHPLFVRVMEIIASNALGALFSADAKFNVPIPDTPQEFRYRPDMGGGALMDLGCYPVHWVRTIFGNAPKIVSSDVEAGQSGVDVTTRATLEFSGGAVATINCSMAQTLPDRLDASLTVKGANGVLTVSNPLQPALGSRLILDAQSSQCDERFEGATFPHQLRYVARQLRGDAPALTGGADAVDNMRVIDQIFDRAGHKK